MEKPEYILNYTKLYFFMMFGLPPLSLLIMFIGIWYGLFSFGLILLLISPLIICRKTLFSKILITDESVTTFYRGKIIESIKWENIKDAMAVSDAGGHISISTKEYNVNAKKGKELVANNHGMPLNLSKRIILEATAYNFKKIPVPIKDFDKLPPYIKKKLESN